MDETRVRFWLQCHAEFGQRMRLVGSHERLGEPNHLTHQTPYMIKHSFYLTRF